MEEFIQEKQAEIETPKSKKKKNGKTMRVVNENTGKIFRLLKTLLGDKRFIYFRQNSQLQHANI